MSIYRAFCSETVDSTGKLVDMSLHFPENLL